MILSELTTLVTAELKSLSSKFAAADYVNAIAAAERDCGWSFPQTTDFRITWLLARTKRHLFSYLCTESAHKFKVDNLHLHQRFDHYKSLVDQADKEFVTVKEENPGEFLGAVDSVDLFGTQISSGFKNDGVGQDITYSNYNEVVSSNE